MGDSPSASSALPTAVYPPGKLEDPPGAPARFSQAEDAGIPAYVKDDNAAKGVPVCPTDICALGRRRYPHIYAKCRDFFPFFCDFLPLYFYCAVVFLLQIFAAAYAAIQNIC